MGLFDAFSIGDFAADIAGDVLSGFGQNFLGGFSGPPMVNSYMPQYSPPPMPVYSQPEVLPVAAGSVPMAARAAAAGIAAWSVRYPALWQALQKLRAQGSKVTIERLWSQLKQFGPGVMTTVIGAAAVADLIAYRTTHKRRRMNVANTRALRRSVRRLRGFDRLSHRVSAQLAASCRPRKRRC